MTCSFNRSIRPTKLIVRIGDKIAPANPAQHSGTSEACAVVRKKPFSFACAALC